MLPYRLKREDSSEIYYFLNKEEQKSLQYHPLDKRGDYRDF